MLKTKLLRPGAKAPTVAHPGSDLGYDLYAAENAVLRPHKVTKVHTGIAVEIIDSFAQPMGAIIFDRSSVGSKGVQHNAGVIDAGYRGEIIVLLTNDGDKDYKIKKGDKIAQMSPRYPMTHMPVVVVDELGTAARGDKGFGSTGK